MNQDENRSDSVECPNCGEPINTDDVADGVIVCSSCGKELTVEEPEDAPAIDADAEIIEPELMPSAPRRKKRRGWKNFFAVIIGMLGGLVVRIVLGIPLALIFSTKDGLPQDISLILELFTAFVAGALAASLVPRLGWLFGMLTQTLRLILTMVALGVWAYLAATDPDVEFHLLDPLRAPVIRTMLFSIMCAAVAGGIAEKYRTKILSFLGSTFGFIGGSFGCLLHSLFGLLQLYFLYLGGKAIFADGKILKGLAIVIFVGPIAGYAIGGLAIGVLMGISWVFSKIYNAYAEDLGVERI